jgi:hypothetical protein
MTVFLLDADIEAGIADRPNPNPSSQGDVSLMHDLGQPLQADRPIKTTGAELEWTDAEVCNRGLARDWCGRKRQTPDAGQIEPQIDGTVIAGRYGLPRQPVGGLLLDPSVEVPVVDHARP